jgi:cytochrome c oxidase subunit 5b
MKKFEGESGWNFNTHVLGSIANSTRGYVDIKSEEDLIPPGATPGTIPTDVEQATGLERFEILGKMQGIDVFDMKPLDASRKGKF